MNCPLGCPSTCAFNVMIGVWPAVKGVSNVMVSTPVVVTVVAWICCGVDCVTWSPCVDHVLATLPFVPLATDTVFVKAQLKLVWLVSHVHQMVQWPPVWYCTNTPTPLPGAAFIVWFGSTSTSIGSLDGAVPPDDDPELELLPPPTYPPPLDGWL